MPSPVKDDNALVKMPTLEEILRRGRFCHSSRYRQKPSLSSLHQNRNAAPYTSQSSNRSGVRNGPSGFPKCFGGGHHTTSCLSPSSIPRQNVGDPIRKRTALKCGLHQNKSPVNEWCDRVLETDRRFPGKSRFDSSPCESQSGRLSPADISRNVRPKSCHTSARWSVNGYVALITDEASCSRVKDHYTKELQVAVRVPLSVRKETGRRLRIDQFWPKLLNLARKDLRSLDGQKPGFCSEARRMFRPVCPRSVLSQLNCIWVRKTSVDSEISIIDFLGVERRKYRERESKKKQISWAHKGGLHQ